MSIDCKPNTLFVVLQAPAFLISISNVCMWRFGTSNLWAFLAAQYATFQSLNDWFCWLFVLWWQESFAVEWFLTQSCFWAVLLCAGLNHRIMFVNSCVCVVFYSVQVSLWKTNKQRKFVTGQLCISSSPDRKPGQLANAEHKNPLPE